MLRSITLVLALSACTQTPPTAGLEMRFSEPDVDPAARTSTEDAGGVAFTIESARAVVRHIRLDLPDGAGCDDVGFEDDDSGLDDDTGLDDSGLRHGAIGCEEDTVEVTGPFVIDLVDGLAEPDLSDLALPAGTWKRVDVRLDEGDVDDGVLDPSDPLVQTTLVASGTFDHEGTPTAFALSLAFNEDIRFESPDGVTVAEGDTLLLGFDAQQWFADVPVSDCLADGDLEIVDGVLVIEDGSGSCSDVEGAIKDAMKRSADLDRDGSP